MPVEPSIDPFPGLRPFEANEGHLFFGREGQSEETLRRLRQHRFLAVVGSSGSGKSSLVRAGLLPYLYGGFLSTAGSHWRVALFRPGSDPIGNLARTLNDPAVIGKPDEDSESAAQSAMLIEVSLRRSGLGLIEAIRLAGLPEHEQVLVVIDQFEELFRFAGAVDKPRHENDAAAFVKLLLEASAQRELPIYVALTMRSDFIGDCARYRGLPEAVTTGLYLIPRMTRDERRSAIVDPVRVGGGSIAPRLVNRLLNDVGDDPDQLPILQHALMRTWDYWKTHGGDSRPVDIDDYLAIGTMAEALSQHADEAYDSLPDERHRAIARRVFQGLSEKGTDNRETRRPTTVETLAQVAGASAPDIIRVIDEFRRPGRSFLTPAPGVALDVGSVIDISHESLIRGWRRLRQWVDEETESATVYRRLAETAALYARGTAGLWHDPDLHHALAWRESEQPNAAWGQRYHPGFEPAMAFLEESRKARDEERRLRTRTRRWALGISTAASIAMAALALFSWTKWREADQHLIEAQQEHDRMKQALDTVADIADTVVFDVVQSLRRQGMQGALTTDMLDRAIRGYDQTIALSPNAQAYRSRGAAYWMKGDYDRAIADTTRAIELEPNNAYAYNSRGIAYKEKGDYDHAIADYDKAIALDPKNVFAYNNRGNAYTSKGDLDRAIADFDQVIALNPKYALGYNNRGIAYYDKKDYDRAVADYEKAIELDPKYVAAYVNSGNARRAKRDFDRAIVDYGQAIALDPTNVEAYNGRGLSYSDKKEYDHAIADYDKAVALDSKYVFAYNNRGIAYKEKGSYDRAIADYDRALALDPKYSLAYNNRGNALRSKGDLDRAIADYDQAIALDPKYALAYRNRGLTYHDKKDYDRAIADYTQAIALNPKYVFAYNNRGNAHRAKGDLDGAIADYDQAIARDPKYTVAYRNRGLVYHDKKDYDRAIADYDKAIALDPKYLLAYDNRGDAHKAKGDFDRAIADYSQVIALDPKYVDAYNDRGIAYYDKADYDHAIADYTQAIALDPKYVYAYNNRGNAYKATGDLDRAIADYDQAIALDPRYALAYSNRGNAYLTMGDPGRALSDFDQEVQLNPKNAFAYLRRALAEVYVDKAGAAADDLATALKIEPAGQYFVLWLHIARSRAGQRDADEIRNNADKLDRDKWPWPIVQLFLGSSTPEAVRTAAQSTDNANTRRNRVCEVDFYLGARLRERGARDEARRLFAAAVAGCPKGYWEYMAAKNELQALK
jgi:tetratricopeptide (TPR) repeat protein